MNARIEQLIEKEIKLPSPPAVAVQILDIVQKEEVSLSALVNVIATDPALTGKLLKIANSSFYSLKSNVTSIDRALAVLGTNIIKNIALSFVIATDFRGDGDIGFDFDDYWRRSVTAAVAAEIFAAQLSVKDDDIFVTALLHDIGMVVIYQNNRDTYSDLLQEARFSEMSFFELEQLKYNYDHQLIGALLLKQWGLPDKISQPIGYHHHPETAPEGFKLTAQILELADQFSTFHNDANSSEMVHKLQNQLEKDFDFSKTQIRSLLDEIAAKSVEILAAFDIAPGEMKPYSQILQEANEELGRLNLSYEQLIIELKDAKEKSEQLSAELKEANFQLSNLVYVDALTGLYNHRYFQESLNNELSRAKRYKSLVSLILLDIDFFKKVNDTYGHSVGDSVLSNIATTIKESIRPSDIVARYGGEEFAIILPETNITELKVLATRLRQNVEKSVTRIAEHQIRITVSVGGTTFDPNKHICNKDHIFRLADQGLYMSKENGRNHVTVLSADDVLSPDNQN